MKKIFVSLFLALILLSCEEEAIERAERVSFQSENIVVKVPRDAVNFERIFEVFTTSISNSDRQFSISVDLNGTTLDASAFGVPSTVTVPANSNKGEFVINFSDVDINFESKLLALDLGSDTLFSGSTVLDVTELCEDTIVQLSIFTDDWPDETSWEIYDLAMGQTLLFSGGPYNNPADDFSTLEFEFCLAPGVYGIAVYDAYGDGIVNGGYEVNANGAVLTAGSVTGTGSSSTFTID